MTALQQAQLRQRLRCATRTLALFSATNIAKHRIRAQGRKVSEFSCADLKAMAEGYLLAHEAELIPEAAALVEKWRREGYFGKRAMLETSALL